MTGDWDQSAAAWIAALGEHGDYTRTHILDPVMKARIAGRGFASALDVGCGEGRFCRIMREHGIATVGIDPTSRLFETRYSPQKRPTASQTSPRPSSGPTHFSPDRLLTP
jgi:2-polyprenyl-3-methyl-5-hydroxy-6-metoxy-1,4-benzoquinol methylase